MATIGTRRWLFTNLAALLLLLTAGLYALAQQIDEAKRDRTVPVAGAKYHVLPATLETTQWGWLDPKEPSKLVVNSGDTVAVETMMHSHNKIQPGTTIEEIVALRKANPGGGPHTVTGPIYVNGAEPGDVMEIRILKIIPKAFGFNFNLPGKEFPTIGALAPEFPDGFVKYFYLDWEKRQAEFKPGVMIELQEGTTLFVPIFLKGGLVWVGDAHCRQGTELNLTALECAYREIVMQLIVRKDMKLEWPRLETKAHWILMGYDEDLNKAMVVAAREVVDFLSKQKLVTLDRYEAYSLASITTNCVVTQVVNVRKGVHCMIPKSIFTAKK